MADWYVTPTGENLADGTIGNAWAGLSAIDWVKMAGTGTLHFKGVFRETGALVVNTARSGNSNTDRLTFEGNNEAEISMLKVMNSGWTFVRNEGIGEVYKIFEATLTLTQKLSRVFVDDVGVLQAPDIASVGTTKTHPDLAVDPMQFYYADGANSEVYLYTENGDPNGTGSVLFSLDGSSSEYVVNIVGNAGSGGNLNIQNMKLSGGSGASVKMQKDIANVTITNCECVKAVTGGISYGSVNETSIATNIVIDGNLITTERGATEGYINNPLTEEVGNGIVLGKGGIISNIVIKNNTITDFGHASFDVLSTTALDDGIYSHDNIEVFNNTLKEVNSIYNRAFGVSGTPGYRKINNLRIHHNHIENFRTRIQMQAVNSEFTNNYIKTMLPDLVYGDRNQAVSCEGYAYTENLLIANNLVDGAPVAYRTHSSTSADDFNGADWKNNAEMNSGVSFEYGEGIPAGILVPTPVENSIFSSDVIDFFGTTKTVDTLNNSNADAYDSLFTGNTTTTPTTDSNGVPLTGSSLIGAGYKYWGNKPRPVDINGEPLADYPDIGLYQTLEHPNHPNNM